MPCSGVSPPLSATSPSPRFDLPNKKIHIPSFAPLRDLCATAVNHLFRTVAHRAPLQSISLPALLHAAESHPKAVLEAMLCWRRRS